MPEARAAMPTIPRSRAAWLLKIPVVSTRSVKDPESINSVIRLSNSVSSVRRWRRKASLPSGVRSCLTPPNAMVPRSSRVPKRRRTAGPDLRVGSARDWPAW